MSPRSLYRTFEEIARETAKELHGGSWRTYSDDILSSLVCAFWCGCFIDGKGQSCTFNFQPPGQTSARDSIPREVVWRCLGDARPRIVSEFHGGTPPPYDILATAKIEDYGRAARQLLENLALPEADARAWVKQYLDHSLAEPSTDRQLEKRGRKPKYDWVAFLHAVIEIADKDNIPVQQAELEELMLKWCKENWGAEPSISAIRMHVAGLYPRPYSDD
mgnify:CR=1 FL=1